MHSLIPVDLYSFPFTLLIVAPPPSAHESGLLARNLVALALLDLLALRDPLGGGGGPPPPTISTRSNRSMSANVWLLLNEGQIKLIFRVPLDGSHLAGFAHLT